MIFDLIKNFDVNSWMFPHYTCSVCGRECNKLFIINKDYYYFSKEVCEECYDEWRDAQNESEKSE